MPLKYTHRFVAVMALRKRMEKTGQLDPFNSRTGTLAGRCSSEELGVGTGGAVVVPATVVPVPAAVPVAGALDMMDRKSGGR